MSLWGGNSKTWTDIDNDQLIFIEVDDTFEFIDDIPKETSIEEVIKTTPKLNISRKCIMPEIESDFVIKITDNKLSKYQYIG